MEVDSKVAGGMGKSEKKMTMRTTMRMTTMMMA